MVVVISVDLQFVTVLYGLSLLLFLMVNKITFILSHSALVYTLKHDFSNSVVVQCLYTKIRTL